MNRLIKLFALTTFRYKNILKVSAGAHQKGTNADLLTAFVPFIMPYVSICLRNQHARRGRNLAEIPAKNFFKKPKTFLISITNI